MLFTCKQAGDGMFYLSGRRLKMAGIFNVEEGKWQDPVPETVKVEGKTKAPTEKTNCTREKGNKQGPL
jgi:hypothetical protein